MLPKNWIARKLGYALSIWSGCSAITIGYYTTGNSFDTIFVRAIIAFLVFGLLGYIGGWIIQRSMRPELSFIYKNSDVGVAQNGRSVEVEQAGN